jgi:hypothetical protein
VAAAWGREVQEFEEFKEFEEKEPEARIQETGARGASVECFNACEMPSGVAASVKAAPLQARTFPKTS